MAIGSGVDVGTGVKVADETGVVELFSQESTSVVVVLHPTINNKTTREMKHLVFKPVWYSIQFELATISHENVVIMNPDVPGDML